MAERAPTYRRITGRGMGLVVYSHLYEGPDHFLQVSSTGFTESYKRFYFRDIQAIILERKPWRLWWAYLLGLLVLLSLLPAFSVTSGIGAAICFGIAAMFAIVLVVNLSLGPSCACYIRTAVQTERLRTLTRLRTGRAFVTRAAQFVSQHQQVAAAAPETSAPGDLPLQPADRPDTIS